MQIFDILSANAELQDALDLADEVDIEDLQEWAEIGLTSQIGELLIETGEKLNGKDVHRVITEAGDIELIEVIEERQIEGETYKLMKLTDPETGDVWYSWVRYEGYGVRVDEEKYVV